MRGGAFFQARLQTWVVEGADGKKKQRWQRRRGTPAKKEFKAPTPGLESMIFKQGDAADAAAFEDVKKALAKYAGTNFRVGSNMAQVAIDELVEPNLVEPSPPTMSTPPTPAEEIARKKWEYELDDYFKDKRAWDDARPRAFQLVLSHVNPELEEKLEASSNWAAIKQAQDIIELLKTVSLVKHDLDLYLNYQHASQDLNTFYKLFKAR